MAAQISFERPFKYVFQDKDWTKKILMGGLVVLSCILVVGFFVLAGYSKKLFLTLVKDENAPIPEIEFGKDLVEGLGVVGVCICWGIGVVIISAIPVIGWLIGSLLGLALSLVLPVALMFYFTTGNFGAAFDFKGIIEFVKLNITNLLLLFLIGLIAGVIGQAGALACGVGALFTAFWALIARTVAMADVWRLADHAPQAAAPGAPPSNDAPPAP